MPADDKALADQPLAVPTSSGPTTPRRGRGFNRSLLKDLPSLAVTRWAEQDTLDIYKDMHGVVALEAEAFLQALEPAARKRNE